MSAAVPAMLSRRQWNGGTYRRSAAGASGGPAGRAGFANHLRAGDPEHPGIRDAGQAVPSDACNRTLRCRPLSASAKAAAASVSDRTFVTNSFAATLPARSSSIASA
jgi:hypothetical protein